LTLTELVPQQRETKTLLDERLDLAVAEAPE
jgi:hypothetical protein